MEINEIQNQYLDFMSQHAKTKGYNLDVNIAFIHLTEEIGEVAQVLTSQKMRKDLYSEEELKEEVADVILEAMVLAKVVGIEDLNKILQQKIAVLQKRHSISKSD